MYKQYSKLLLGEMSDSGIVACVKIMLLEKIAVVLLLRNKGILQLKHKILQYVCWVFLFVWELLKRLFDFIQKYSPFITPKALF